MHLYRIFVVEIAVAAAATAAVDDVFGIGFVVVGVGVGAMWLLMPRRDKIVVYSKQTAY